MLKEKYINELKKSYVELNGRGAVKDNIDNCNLPTCRT